MIKEIKSGSKDESFVAKEFEPVIKNNSIGDTFVIQGVSIDGIRHRQAGMQRISELSRTYQLDKP